MPLAADLAHLQLSYVKRWVVAPTYRDQTVAEHVYRVTMIARAICFALDYDAIETGMIIGMALTHDSDEVMTGDIPGPSKAIQFPILDMWHRVVKVADAIETGTYWVQWGNRAAWGNHPYNVAPIRDIKKIIHYADQVPGLPAIARAIWLHITGEALSWQDQTSEKFSTNGATLTETSPIKQVALRT